MKEKLDYDSAIQSCNNQGGRLFEPRSKAVNKLVFEISTEVFSGVHKAWIGINDKKTQGEFVYTSSGEKITSSDWAFFQPDNMAGSLGFFKWQTADCVIFGLN